jgi:hypothetical protein
MADDFNPYSAPQTSSTQPVVEGSGLKSLGQEARKTSLNKARWIMIVIGVLTIGLNIFQYFAIQEEIKKVQRQGMVLDPAAVTQVMLPVYAFVGVGVIYILMGVFIYHYPVPFTITALVLYIGGQLVSAALSEDPRLTLVSGFIIKILIIAGLWKAIQASQAYEKERRMAPYGEF